MQQSTLLLALPAFAMVLLTIIVLFTLAARRFKAAKNKQVDPNYYKLYRGDSGEPDEIRKVLRNYTNLYEAPVLFYLGIVFAILFKVESNFLLYTAWIFVAFRYIHSYVHCTSNRIKWRFRSFLLSLIALITYWIGLLIILFS